VDNPARVVNIKAVPTFGIMCICPFAEMLYEGSTGGAGCQGGIANGAKGSERSERGEQKVG